MTGVEMVRLGTLEERADHQTAPPSLPMTLTCLI